MILEPVLDTPFVKIVLEVTGQRHNILLWFKFAQTDAALVQVRKFLCTPLHSEHFVQHLCHFTLLLAGPLSPLEPLVEEVRDKAGEEDCAQDKHNCWERPNYQRHVIYKLQ